MATKAPKFSGINPGLVGTSELTGNRSSVLMKLFDSSELLVNVRGQMGAVVNVNVRVTRELVQRGELLMNKLTSARDQKPTRCTNRDVHCSECVVHVTDGRQDSSCKVKPKRLHRTLVAGGSMCHRPSSSMLVDGT
ncbi:unnamed protein product [Pleuronectes platessa]|uniref:Uncharacterized protein n=1 Tax=Pleuronectes platessa TaxID=8262 RepID=A0A9N7TP13_PLEPL|nr:unnamed protein product [Pleuronectes platessa]